MKEEKDLPIIELELGGKVRTLHFSPNFWAEFTDTIGIPLQDIGDVIGVDSSGVATLSFRHFIDLVYSAIAAHDLENGIEVDYNNYTVGTWMADLKQDQIQTIMKAFSKGKLLGNSLDPES